MDGGGDGGGTEGGEAVRRLATELYSSLPPWLLVSEVYEEKLPE